MQQSGIQLLECKFAIRACGADAVCNKVQAMPHLLLTYSVYGSVSMEAHLSQ